MVVGWGRRCRGEEGEKGQNTERLNRLEEVGAGGGQLEHAVDHGLLLVKQRGVFAVARLAPRRGRSRRGVSQPEGGARASCDRAG